MLTVLLIVLLLILLCGTGGYHVYNGNRVSNQGGCVWLLVVLILIGMLFKILFY